MKISAKVLVPLLALALVTLSSYSYFELEHHLPYPAIAEIESDYQSYVGEYVSIYGVVVKTTEEGSVISSDGLEFTVNSITANVGDRVEVKEKATCAVYDALNRARISIPFPQMDVHIKKK